MIEKSVVISMMLRITGRVTDLKRCQALAPSSAAASCSSMRHRLQSGQDRDREKRDAAPDVGQAEREPARSRRRPGS